MIKVLENDGTIISGTDGAIINKALTNDRNGILQGRLSGFAVTITSSSITVLPGHLMLYGLNVVSDESVVLSVTPTESQTKLYLYVKVVSDSYGINAELLLTNTEQYTRMDFLNEVVSGTAYYLLYEFTVGPSGIAGRTDRRQYLLTYPKLYEHVLKIKQQVYEGNIELYVTYISSSTADEIMEGLFLEDFLHGKFHFTGRVDTRYGIIHGAGIVEFNDYGVLEGCNAYITDNDINYFSLDEGIDPVIISSRRIL